MKLGIYQHYKGLKYEVIGTAIHSETLEELIIYKQLYESSDYPIGTIWVRPKEMFEETIQINDKILKRFELINN